MVEIVTAGAACSDVTPGPVAGRRPCSGRPLLFVLVLVLAASSVPAQPAVTELLRTGPESRRVDVVFLSEGYTEAELPRFVREAEYTSNKLFSEEPFKEYRNYFNTFALAVASAQSGSDIPSLGIYRETYFNSSYGSYGLEQALTIPPNDLDPDPSHGYGKAYALLQNLLPAWDLLVFIVNERSYGGWGDKRGVIVAANLYIGEVTAHEIGHALASLGDEYSSPFPEDPEPVLEEANTTQENRREFIKWKAWIDPGTPIPTPATQAYENVVGLFEGARYQSRDWYRPKLRCRMNDWADPFCEVCTEALVKTFYARVGAIESVSPPGPVVRVSGPGIAEFSVSPMVPASQALSVTWYLDGRLLPGATSTRLAIPASLLGFGSHEIGVEVTDGTPLVRSDPDRLLSTRVQWRLARERHYRGSGRRR